MDINQVYHINDMFTDRFVKHDTDNITSSKYD